MSWIYLKTQNKYTLFVFATYLAKLQYFKELFSIFFRLENLFLSNGAAKLIKFLLLPNLFATFFYLPFLNCFLSNGAAKLIKFLLLPNLFATFFYFLFKELFPLPLCLCYQAFQYLKNSINRNGSAKVSVVFIKASL